MERRVKRKRRRKVFSLISKFHIEMKDLEYVGIRYKQITDLAKHAAAVHPK